MISGTILRSHCFLTELIASHPLQPRQLLKEKPFRLPMPYVSVIQKSLRSNSGVRHRLHVHECQGSCSLTRAVLKDTPHFVPAATPSQGSQSSGCVATCSLWLPVGSKRWTDWVTDWSSLRNLSLASRCHSRCRSQKVHGERPQGIGSRGARSKRAGQRGEKNRGPTHWSRHTNNQTEAMKPLRWRHTWAPRQCFWNVSSTPILTIKSPLPRQTWVPYKYISHHKTCPPTHQIIFFQLFPGKKSFFKVRNNSHEK